METLYKYWIDFYLFIKLLYGSKKKLRRQYKTKNYYEPVINNAIGFAIYNILSTSMILVSVVLHIFNYKWDYVKTPTLRFGLPILLTIIAAVIIIRFDEYNLPNKISFYRKAIIKAKRFRKWHTIFFIIITFLLFFIGLLLVLTTINFK